MGKVTDTTRVKSLLCVCGCCGLRMTAVFVYPCVVFQLLAELLRSKNPEDLQEANRLIKNMVKEVRTAQVHHHKNTVVTF